MRHAFQTQPDLQITPIEKIRLLLKSRDELPPILAERQRIRTGDHAGDEQVGRRRAIGHIQEGRCGELELDRRIACRIPELLDELRVPCALRLARLPQRPGIRIDGKVRLARLRRPGGRRQPGSAGALNVHGTSGSSGSHTGSRRGLTRGSGRMKACQEQSSGKSQGCGANP